MSRVFSFPDGAARGAKPDGVGSLRAEDALDILRAGRMVVLKEESGSGALLMAAEHTTPAAVSLMSAHGALRVAITPERFDELRIPIGREAGLPDGTNVGVPVDLRENGQRDGLLDESIAGRAATVRALCDPSTGASRFVRPGQIFPVRADPAGGPGGRNDGLPGVGLALVSLAGLRPAALVCRVLENPISASFVGRHGLGVVEVGEALDLLRDRALRRDAEVLLPTRFGEFRVRAYVDDAGQQTHLALIAGEPEGKEDVLAHVHSPCLVGDVLRSLRCDCGVLLEAAMMRVQTEGEGVIVYARAEARRIAPADVGVCPTEREAPADTRHTAPEDYAVGARIFRDMGLGEVRLLTDSRWRA